MVCCDMMVSGAYLSIGSQFDVTRLETEWMPEIRTYVENSVSISSHGDSSFVRMQETMGEQLFAENCIQAGFNGIAWNMGRVRLPVWI